MGRCSSLRGPPLARWDRLVALGFLERDQDEPIAMAQRAQGMRDQNRPVFQSSINQGTGTMKLARRSFLRQAGTLIALGAGMPAAPLRAAVRPGVSSSEILSVSSDWSARLRCLGWVKMGADIRSVATASTTSIGIDVPASMRMRLEGRAEISERPAPDAPNYHLPDLTMSFTQTGADAPVLHLDLDFEIESPISIIPGLQVAATGAWLAAGMTFEEWLCRTLLGSYMDEFPMYFDQSYFRMLCSREQDVDRLASSTCAISLCRMVPGDASREVRAAIDDVAETLRLKGYKSVDNFFMTYHGSESLDAFFNAIGEVNSCVGTDTSHIVGHDWDKGLSPPLLSIIGRGAR